MAVESPQLKKSKKTVKDNNSLKSHSEITDYSGSEPHEAVTVGFRPKLDSMITDYFKPVIREKELKKHYLTTCRFKRKDETVGGQIIFCDICET